MKFKCPQTPEPSQQERYTMWEALI